MADASDPDSSKPNAARMYDYWLGGTNNFPADRAAGEAVRRQQPDISVLAVENKQFLTRAVTYVARQGVRQFLDVGSGLPTSPVPEHGVPPRWLATHEAAQAVDPGALVAYLDHDPVAVAHSQALLAQDSGSVIAAQADMLDPDQVADLFTGLDLVPPGIVPAPAWRPEPPAAPLPDRAAAIVAGVGRRS